MSKNTEIVSASMDKAVATALKKYAKGSPFTLSVLMTIAAAQLVGVPYEPKRKLKGENEND